LRAATAADGCTELVAALATLPSGLFEIVADAVAALSVELQSNRTTSRIGIGRRMTDPGERFVAAEGRHVATDYADEVPPPDC
jgi:hypothetical protein